MPGQVQNLAPEAVHAFLNSRPEGLADAEIAARRAELGPNRLDVRRPLRWLPALARQLTSFFALLLDASAVICFVADRLQPGQGMALLGAALLGVSILNALFGFVQEYRAERAMAALRRFLPQRVRVRRAGEHAEVAADELVPGDVVSLAEGDRAPADLRVAQCDGLLVDNAPLTGESRPVELTHEAVEGPLEEAHNLAFAGCTVLRGTGVGVVFATGFRTRFGRIAGMSQAIRREPAPLERETAHMVRVLTVIAVVMGVAFFAYGVYAGRSLWVNLVFMMGIIVANVPEGLLPTFTLSLAMGSLRMARRNVLVKSLGAVEALGAVHVVCTDKTGTLTENRLALSRLVDAAGADVTPGEGEARLLTLALVASDVEPAGGGYQGDPLDVAVAQRYAGVLGDPAPLLSRVERRWPFDAGKRHAAGAARDGDGLLLAVKGAWESVAPMLAAGTDREAAGDVVHRLASAGHRVLAVAERPIAALPEEHAGHEGLARDLALAGFLCLEDPLRAEVPDAVRRCREAGVHVIMITGDHPDTALAVACRAGIVAAGEDARPVTGAELARLRERDLVARLEAGARVFARTTPEQKMHVVAALHQLDRVVAVTGDGVNDAPALKAADVGIAMGRSGTDVARESAQVVLLDDNFASIVAGIEEGRTIFANIRKFTSYVLVSNGPEIIPYLLYILFPVPLALTVIQILTIDLGTDIVPSIALGQEPPDRQVMREPPRRREAGLLTPSVLAHSYGFLGLIEAAFSLALFFWVLDDGGWRWGETLAADDPLYHSATGIALAAILLTQVGNLVGRRSRDGSGIDRGLVTNRLIVIGVALEALFSWAVLYFEPLARVLGTGPVPAHVYATAWLGVPLIFGLDYARKRIALRLRASVIG